MPIRSPPSSHAGGTGSGTGSGRYSSSGSNTITGKFISSDIFSFRSDALAPLRPTHFTTVVVRQDTHPVPSTAINSLFRGFFNHSSYHTQQIPYSSQQSDRAIRIPHADLTAFLFF